MSGVESKAVASVFKMVDICINKVCDKDKPTAMLAIGNADFGSQGKHSSFMRRLVDEARSHGILCWSTHEYGTSIKCPRCQCEESRTEFLQSASTFRDRTRVKYCPRCHMWFHRDVMAGENMTYLGEAHLRGNERPAYLCPPNQPRQASFNIANAC